MARIVWNGAAVRARVAAAAAAGIDTTLAKCVGEAKADHPAYPPASEPYERYANRTGFETGSIQIFREATLEHDRVGGSWGASGEASLFLEIGTSIVGPTAAERAAFAGGDMSLIPPPIGPLMAPRPFLRPAADREYPLLGARIGAIFRGEPVP